MALLSTGMLLTLSACKAPETAVPDPAKKVSMMQVERVDVSERYSLIGEIVARQVTGYSFPASGRVLDVVFDAGDTVAAGDMLARIDDTTLQASVAGARAALSAAQSQSELAAAQYKRQQSLMQQGFTTRSALEAANTSFRSAQSEVISSRARLDNAADALGKGVLRADADGIVLTRFVEPGQIVQAGQSVVSVATSVERDAIFDIPEAVFLQEFPETPVELSLVGESGVTTTGTIREISPLVNPAEGTVRIILSVSEKGSPLPIGAAVRGTAMTSAKSEFSLPWTVLDATSDRPTVWVVTPGTGTVHQQPVNVSRYESDAVIINDGLSNGDWVVSSGRQFIKTGERLEIEGRGAIKPDVPADTEALNQSGVSHADDVTSAGDPGPKTRPVLWMTSGTANSASAKLPGTIVAREENKVGFTLSGRLVAREVAVGDSVQKGERLAAIDAAPYELALLAVEADLSAARNRYQNAVAEETRYAELVQSDSTTRVDYDNARNTREAAEAAVAQASASLATARDELDNTVIHADFDGVITQASLEVGELALPGATVLALANPAIREAVIDVPAQVASGLKTGMAVDVVLEIAPERIAHGRVRFVAPNADSATQLFRVHIALELPGISFHLGSTIIASVPLETVAGLRLPDSAVFSNKGIDQIWRYDRTSRAVSPMSVEILEKEDGFVTIRGDFDPEQIIVAAGVNHLEDGQQVSLGEELSFD